MNAYKLADEIGNIKNFIAEGTLKQVANMLRQQEDCIAGLEKQLKQTKPLSDEEIGKVYEELYEMKLLDEYPLKFARAIEERHGIK